MRWWMGTAAAVPTMLLQRVRVWKALNVCASAEAAGCV